MDAIGVIEEYFGDELTGKLVERIAGAPVEHLGPLISRLAEHYGTWLEREERAATEEGAEEQDRYYFGVDPFPAEWDRRVRLNRFKRLLLYIPRLAAPDPLAELIGPAVMAAHLSGGRVAWDERMEVEFRDTLWLLAELAPAAKRGDVKLVPWEDVIFEKSLQASAQAELRALSNSAARDEYYRPIREAARSPDALEGFARYLAEMKADRESRPADHLEEMRRVVGGHGGEGIPWMVTEHLKLAGQVCARLSYAPVAANGVVYAALRQDYGLGGGLNPIPSLVHRVGAALVRYDVPNLGGADLRTILKLRADDDAFAAFRADFAHVLERAHGEGPTDDRQWEVEFKQAADDILRPRLEEVKRATTTSVIEKLVIPQALAIGGGTVAYTLLGAPDLPLATMGGSAMVGPANWLLSKLHLRWKRSGRKAAVLREAYGLVLGGSAAEDR